MKTLLVVLVGLAIAQSASADVWKCKVADRTIFSDVPCPDTGKQIDSRMLQANIVAPHPVPAQTEHRPSSAGSVDAGGDYEQSRARGNDISAAPRSECPSDREIANMQTAGSSVTLGAKQRLFIADEVRRARQCRAGQGHYSADDWKQSRQARDAQNNISGGASDRINAEGVHSAADPIEGDRIARRRVQDESDRRVEEALREARLQAQTQAQAQMRILTCDPRGCRTPSGYYRRISPNVYQGPGGSCRVEGVDMRC